MQNDLLTHINEQFALSLSAGTGREMLENILAERINFLIIHDFNWLVQALYRIDVNEKRLEGLLKANAKQDAGNIIAVLVIERQLEKIRSRGENRRDTDHIEEQDRW